MSPPSWGKVLPGEWPSLPFLVVGDDGAEVEPISRYLRDLSLGDASPLTCRSYGHDLLRWWRILRGCDVDWRQATEAEVAVLVGWMRIAPNPQRARGSGKPARAGSTNLKTGKPYLGDGYAKRTINHTLTVVREFYEFHRHHGRGPLMNPVPVSPQRRQRLAHRSPLEPAAQVHRSRLRQKVVEQPPRSIPDALWDELFAAMGCDRDRALACVFVSSGGRAAEVLGIGVEDIDWAGQRVWVVSKGSRLREPIPASPDAFVYLTRYLHAEGNPPSGTPVWRTRRGKPRPLTYWALRRILQRANEKLGTNWTWHDLRHTAATRMANDPHLNLAEVQTVLRHRNLKSTQRYVVPHLEEVFTQMQQHYLRPRTEPVYPSGYAADDIAAVFGG